MPDICVPDRLPPEREAFLECEAEEGWRGVEEELAAGGDLGSWSSSSPKGFSVSLRTLDRSWVTTCFRRGSSWFRCVSHTFHSQDP